MNYLKIMPIFLTATVFFCHASGSKGQITYYGHSCFEFNYAGQRIIIDPFTPELFDYERPKGKIDYGFASHDARDHAFFNGLDVEKTYYASGETDAFELKYEDKEEILTGRITETFADKKITIWTVPSFHDDVQGARNGVNGIICFDFDGLKIVHLGDIGHVLEEKQISGIGKVDILMVPVDSYYIVELEAARTIVDQLSPTVIIPMHYKTEKSKNEAYMDDLDKFIKMFNNVKRAQSTITIRMKDYKVAPCLLVLEYVKGHE